MKKYGELDLKKLREKCNIDFAHFTFRGNECSCCFGPKDFPTKYWKNEVIPEHNDYSFILFKNAFNGSGQVTKNDFIENNTYILYDLNEEQMNLVCEELKEQLGENYVVIKPKTNNDCIKIETVY